MTKIGENVLIAVKTIRNVCYLTEMCVMDRKQMQIVVNACQWLKTNARDWKWQVGV